MAPDGYPEWGYVTYESNMANLKSLWTEIRPQLMRDPQKIEFIDEKLTEMFSAFARGEAKQGQDLAWLLYNLNVKGLR